jgi:two-component system invasion response regulator UvrY
MNVLNIEHHPVTALGVEKLFKENFDDITYYHTSDGENIPSILKETSFDVIVLDIIIPNTDIHNLLIKIRNKQPNAKILIFSHYSEGLYAMHYISLGVNGYLRKSSSVENFVFAIKMILNGQLYISNDLVQKNMDTKTKKFTGNHFETLSNRELEIFGHIVNGISMKRICNIMSIEQSTSATLKKRMMQKLKVNNMVELVKLSIINGY